MTDYAAAVDSLDVVRGAFLASLDALPPAARVVRPADGAWSADDVAEHLMRTERGLVGGLERQIAAGDARRDVGTPSTDALTMLLDRLTDDESLRYPMPEAAAPFIAPTGLDPADVRAEWHDLAARWRRLVETLPADIDGVGLVRHPLIGAVTAAGAARFVAAHIAHHERQLGRIAASDAVRHATGL